VDVPEVDVPEVDVPEVDVPERISGWFESSIIRGGTVLARLQTWDAIVRSLSTDGSWLLGGSAGSDYMYELCTGEPVAPLRIAAGDPKCPVDDAGPSPVVRDPHNWVLNLVLYHGVVGLAVFSIAIFVPMWQARRSEDSMLPIGGLLTYLVMGLTFLISAGYALIPMAVFVAWLVRNGLIQDGIDISDARDRHVDS